MLVVGTAGHIDHGKSAVVKRLTGTDPDRLPEEKARGMTIDLGFAFYRTSANDTIAFVDVPGHERFVKNMVAGVGAIDSVMLVVAADDGWMPQSEEHFQIVKLLDIRHGAILINKTDLVDTAWLDLLEQDIREKVQDSFLANAPIFRVSAQNGQGFGELEEYLNDLSVQLKSQRDSGKARMYIDRSFIRPGIGGVVTGTLRGGTLKMGQAVGLWPSMKEAKIRSLHSNNQGVEVARPGQRTAISFTGVDKEHLVRGGVIIGRTDLSFFHDHPVLALSVTMIPNAAVALEDRRRILVIIGTSEVEGDIRLYKAREIRSGQKGIIFFRPDEPMYGLVGDHFIARLPTPMITLGGGQILDHFDRFPRRKDIEKYDYLEQRMPGGLDNLILSELKKRTILKLDGMLAESHFASEDVQSGIKELWQKKMVKMFEGCVYHEDYFNLALEGFRSKIAAYLEGKSHLKGLSPDQIASVSGTAPELTELLVKYMVFSGSMVRLKDTYNLTGRDMSLKGPVKAAHDEILVILKDDPLMPPSLSSLAGRGKAHRDAIKFIIDSGEGYKVGSDFVFLAEAWEQIIKFIRDTITKKRQLSVADLKDKFELSRKFVIPILEETDRVRLTRRDGDMRVKGDRFEEEEFTL